MTDWNKSVKENASSIHIPQLFIEKYIEEVVIKAGQRRKEVVLLDKGDNTNRKRLLWKEINERTTRMESIQQCTSRSALIFLLLLLFFAVRRM